jgi:hypothetical protein
MGSLVTDLLLRAVISDYINFQNRAAGTYTATMMKEDFNNSTVDL